MKAIARWLVAASRIQKLWDHLYRRSSLTNHADDLRSLERRLRGEIFQNRRVLAHRVRPEGRVQEKAPVPLNSAELDEYFRRLQAAAPEAFAIWRELFDVGSAAYTGFPTDSCSVEGHAAAELFRCFLAPYLHGTVLDIGCGPQPVPWYLTGYPTELIAGVDPLAPENHGHPFVFAKGVAEFLPWEDGSFDVVVVATSLDHVLLLDVALREIRRVLRPGGYFVTWVGFVPGAQPYDPYRPQRKAIDSLHLFHFDEPWFLQPFADLFRLLEEFNPIELGLTDGSRFFAFVRS